MDVDQKHIEQEIVNQTLAGNNRAVRQLYELVAPRLKRYFAGQTQMSEDIEELLQDTFLHLLDALPLFQFQSSITTFTLSIAKHELMDYWRKKYAKRIVRTIPLLKNLSASPYQSVKVSQAIRHEMERAYAKLGPMQVQLLKWKYEEGKSVKEMADHMGLTVKSVEARLYRARKAFQEVYVTPTEVWE